MLLALFLLTLTPGSGPQAVPVTINTAVVSFLPSPDHDAVGRDGFPLVAWYEIEIYREDDDQPFLVVGLGKPHPSPDGAIHVALMHLLGTSPMPGERLHARVAAVGPGGRGRSEQSNDFVFNFPPAVRVTSPANGSQFAVSRGVGLSADAADFDGRVRAVSFYVDGAVVGTATARPYRARWRPVAGTHSIVAVAIDDRGETVTSRAVTVTVLPNPGAAQPAKPRIKK